MSRTVLITGASSGIGAALAERYACEGSNLLLIARRPAPLAEVAERCRKAGAGHVETGAFDVRARDDVAAWVRKKDEVYAVDLLIANAGVTGGTGADGVLETADQSLEILETNVLGTAIAVHAALPGMIARRSGQIAIVSSIAAFLPQAGLASYCASKAADLSYALSLRETLRPIGIRVSAICPGYVDTPLLRRIDVPYPTLMSPAIAAERIFQGLARNKRIVAFPAFYVALTRLFALLPPSFLPYLIPAIRVTPVESK